MNKTLTLKVILFFYALFLSLDTQTIRWQLYALWIIILTILYFVESLKFIIDIVRRKAKKPVFTSKIILLASVSVICEILFIILSFNRIKVFYWFVFWFLIVDILTPLIISLLVLIFQPHTVFMRYRIINKAKQKRAKFPKLLVIGVTGSYGKTSVKEFLAAILEKKYPGKVLKTKEHQNSEMGISQCILNDLNSAHEIFVVEMGAYNKGGIKLLCDIVNPKIGILTGINEQHMATFGSQENIIKTKFELINSLPSDGTAILNWDNKLIAKSRLSKIKIIKYSAGKKADIWAENIAVGKDFVSFRGVSKDGDAADFRANVSGEHNILNILGATAGAKFLGLSLPEIAKTCAEITNQAGAMKLKRGIHGLNIIDSTYSANPDGVISALEYLKIWPARKVIIMPCLIELGKSSKEIHKKIGEKISEICDLAIITTKDRLKEIKEGAMIRGMKEENILFEENPRKILEKIKNFCKEYDVVLLESRVPKELISELTIE